jgi:hypothetical protein
MKLDREVYHIRSIADIGVGDELSVPGWTVAKVITVDRLQGRFLAERYDTSDSRERKWVAVSDVIGQEMQWDRFHR